MEDVDASACEGDDGLMVGLAFGSFARVEGPAGGVVERAEGGLEEDAFERLVAAAGALEVADLARLLENGCEPGCGRELVGGLEAFDRACLGDELCRQGDPHPRQAADEGRVRVALEQRFELVVERGDPFTGTPGVVSELAHDFMPYLLTAIQREADAGVFSSLAMRVRCAAAEAGVAISRAQAERIAHTLELLAPTMAEAA